MKQNFRHTARSVASIVALALISIAGLRVSGAPGREFAGRPAAIHSSVGMDALSRHYFEANIGQFPKEVRFSFRGKSGTVGVTNSGLMFPGGASIQWRKPGQTGPASPVDGIKPLPGKTNYLRGSDPTKWKSGASHFEEALVSNAFPGIDLRLYFSNGLFEYDLIIAPGTTPATARFTLSGWKRVAQRPDGSIRLESKHFTATQRPPQAYQTIDGVIRPVPSQFRISPNQEHLDLIVERIDPTRSLIVDPVIEMSLLLGGNDFDSIYAAKTDAAGDLYLAGTTRSNDLPVRSSDSLRGPLDFSQNGGNDAFVAKVSATGDLRLLTYLGGSGTDEATSIAVAADSSIYVAGHTQSSDFPAKAGFGNSYSGRGLWYGDGFIARVSADGSSLMSSTFVGTKASDIVRGIAIGPGGFVVAVGATDSTEFPTTVDFFPATRPGLRDAFVIQFDASLGTLQFATSIRGSNEDEALGVGVDFTGAIWLCGFTRSTDFPTVNAIESRKLNGTMPDGFAVKIASNRLSAITSTILGGTDLDSANSLFVDAGGDVYISGVTASLNFPVLMAFQSTLKGGLDAFVTKLNSAGTRILFSTYFGGSADEASSTLTVNGNGDVYICGTTNSIDLPILGGAKKATSGTGDSDGFIAGIAKAGNQLLFSTFIGGSSDEFLNAIVDQGSHLIVVGGTRSPNFPYTKAIKPNRRLPGFDDYDGVVVRLRLDSEVSVQPVIDGIRNAASFDVFLSPGSWVSIFGNNLIPSTIAPRGWSGSDFVGNQLPLSMEGVSVLFDGRAAAISYVSPNQINVQVPDVSPSSLIRVDVRSSLGMASTQIAVKAISPSFFTLASSGSARLVAAVFADGRLVGNPEVLPGARPAKPGDVILLYGTGFGPTSPQQAAGFAVNPAPIRARCTVRIGNQVAEVLYAGLVGPGLNQVNIRVPNLAPGDYQIAASADTEQTQGGVLLSIGR